MHALKQYIPLLKKGTSNNGVPFYSNLIKFTGNSVETCNTQVYVKVKFESQIKGCTNFFVLEKAITRLPATTAYLQKDNQIKLANDTTKFSLPIDDIEFPDIPIEDMELIDVDEELYNTLTLAVQFCSTDKESRPQEHPYVYISNTEIIATDGKRLFVKDVNVNLTTPLALSRTVISTLSVGSKVGSASVNGLKNTVVITGDATMVFVCKPDVKVNFPLTQIHEMLNGLNEKVVKITNIVPFMQGINQVSSIFINEKDPVINLDIIDNTLVIEASTMLTGSAKYVIPEIPVDGNIHISVSPTKLINLPTDYDLYIDTTNSKRLVFKNNNSIVVIAAME